jgi:hypothetical protein
MKTQNYLSLLAIVATALSMNIATTAAQSVDSAESLKNSAVAASPRAKEVFPWLRRAPSSRSDACCDKVEVKNELTEARKNRAYAASPRVREMFPELGRDPTPRREFTIAPLVEKNAAVLSSPRYREQRPALSRGTTPGTAKGGASDLLELGR